jgi:hypothetical protein
MGLLGGIYLVRTHLDVTVNSGVAKEYTIRKRTADNVKGMGKVHLVMDIFSRNAIYMMHVFKV